MAKKPIAPQTICEQGGPEKLADEITIGPADSVLLESWLCTGAGEVRVWVDPPAQLGAPDYVIHDHGTGPIKIGVLPPGDHWILWMLLSPSENWVWRSEISVERDGVKLLGARHRMRAANVLPPAMASLEVKVQ